MKALAAAIALALTGCAGHPAPAAQASASSEQLAARITEVETASGGRLGVALYSQNDGLVFSHRGAERFAMCSTFKLALAAMALDTPGLRDARLDFGEDDLLSYAPYAQKRAAIGWMSGMEAAHHAVTLSDNTAANLLLTKLGGPDAFTAWLREIGDEVTRLDRNEPALNENAPGDPRDTTTPDAMAGLVGSLLWSDRLPAADRAILRGWLVETPTGMARLRAGLPKNWNPGDKTGTCGGEARAEVNDIAVFETPDGTRYVLTAFLDRPTGSTAEAEAGLADAAHAIAEWIRAGGA
ncbi:class A beta-lactamase [Citromicrobium bathyomarinum]|uniref:class A beta-lactamase n=1 Tax=Citromicrobium bathyomarinum TaxID=72174 RepID=UPI0031599EC1